MFGLMKKSRLTLFEYFEVFLKNSQKDSFHISILDDLTEQILSIENIFRRLTLVIEASSELDLSVIYGYLSEKDQTYFADMTQLDLSLPVKDRKQIVKYYWQFSELLPLTCDLRCE